MEGWVLYGQDKYLLDVPSPMETTSAVAMDAKGQASFYTSHVQMNHAAWQAVCAAKSNSFELLTLRCTCAPSGQQDGKHGRGGGAVVGPKGSLFASSATSWVGT